MAAVAFFISQTRIALGLTLAAVLLSVALNHAIERLERRGLRRSLAVAAIAIGILALLLGFGLLIIPPAISQGKALVSQFPQFIEKAKSTALYQSLNSRFQIESQLQLLADQAYGHAQAAVAPALKAIGSVVSIVAGGITIFFLVIFMLAFGERLVKAALAETLPSHRERYRRILRKIYGSIGGYLAGLTLICSVNAVLTTIFLAIARMPFFLPLGILSGVSSVIPFIGPAITGTLITLLSFLTGGISRALVTAIYFIAYGQMEGQVLSPLIYRQTVKMNPLITLLSVLFFADLAGVAGAIVAVPIAATLLIILREFVSMRSGYKEI